MNLGSLKRGFVALALRRALPGTPLIPYARLGLLGFTAAIAGGLLFTLACTALLGALFFYLRDQGISPAYALLVLAGISLVAAAWIFFATQRFVFTQLDKERALLPPRPPEEALLDIPGTLLNSFLQGMLDRDNMPRHRH
jgi:hypothetical protein